MGNGAPPNQPVSQEVLKFPQARPSIISPRILFCCDSSCYVVVACMSLGFFIANGTWSSPAMLALKCLPALILSLRCVLHCVLSAVHSSKWKLTRPRAPYPIEIAICCTLALCALGDLFMELDTQCTRIHFLPYSYASSSSSSTLPGVTVAGFTVFFAVGFASFFISHIVLLCGICLFPSRGMPHIFRLAKDRGHSCFAIAMPFLLLLATIIVVFAVVASAFAVFFLIFYVGVEMLSAWALLNRYKYYSFEVQWRQLVAGVGMILFIFSDLIIALKTYVEQDDWTWHCFACERILYMIPYYSALACLSCLVPICGYPTTDIIQPDKDETEPLSSFVIMGNQEKIPPELISASPTASTSAPSPRPLAEVMQLQSMNSLSKFPEKVLHSGDAHRIVREPPPPVPPPGAEPSHDVPQKSSADEPGPDSPPQAKRAQSQHSLKSSTKTLPPLARTPPPRVGSPSAEEPKQISASSEQKSSDESIGGGVGMEILTSSMRPSAESVADALPLAFGTATIKPILSSSSVSSLPPLKRVPISSSMGDVAAVDRGEEPEKAEKPT